MAGPILTKESGQDIIATGQLLMTDLQRQSEHIKETSVKITCIEPC